MPRSKRTGQDKLQSLLRKHRLHAGLYARVAKRLRIDMSYVSRVANGKRTSERIMSAILEELRRIERE
ncbi:MAG TPA: hypothetical protein VF011_21310 [Terriglobales bacterium]